MFEKSNALLEHLHSQTCSKSAGYVADDVSPTIVYSRALAVVAEIILKSKW